MLELKLTHFSKYYTQPKMQNSHNVMSILDQIDGSVQDCSNSIANVPVLLQSCPKPSITVLHSYVNRWFNFQFLVLRYYLSVEEMSGCPAVDGHKLG